eukprot:scaffold281_cov282-Ochromonas_danica.AAC.14
MTGNNTASSFGCTGSGRTGADSCMRGAVVTLTGRAFFADRIGSPGCRDGYVLDFFEVEQNMFKPQYHSSSTMLRPRVTTIQEVAERTAHITLPGKRAIVIGGTSGIGEGIARRLAKAQVSITIVGRDADRGQAIVKELGELG